MKLAVVLFLCLGCLGQAQEASAHEDWRAKKCRYQFVDHHKGWTYQEVKDEISCAVRKWPVLGGVAKAVAVASCESGLNETALGGAGDGYGGVFQQSLYYWPGRLRALHPPGWDLGPSVFNGRSNALISVRMAHNVGWSPWSCA